MKGFRHAGAALAAMGLAAASVGATPTVVAKQADIQAFLGGLPGKLVFGVGSTGTSIYYIDFQEAGMPVHVLSEGITVNVPVISPDGNSVAFSTKSDGLSSSPLYGFVHELKPSGFTANRLSGAATVPRWWIDPWTHDTDLVYTNSGVDDNSAAKNVWNSDIYTFKIKVSGSKPVGNPDTIAPGPLYGGMSRDGQWLGAGYTRAYLRNMLSGVRFQTGTAAARGLPGGSEQLCNPSITPSGTKTDELMILDLGSPDKVSPLVGRAYGEHEVIYITDASDKVVNWISTPTPGIAIDQPDWSNHPDYAVANLEDPNSAQHTDLVLINLKTKQILKVVTHGAADDLWQPSLWVKNDSTAQPFQASRPAYHADAGVVTGVKAWRQGKGKVQGPALWNPALGLRPQGQAYDAAGRKQPEAAIAPEKVQIVVPAKGEKAQSK